MANPQKENGYTVIANEILEKICSYRISGEEHLIMWTIIRKTYGYNKKEDRISLSQFSKFTGMKRPTCQRALSKLVSKKIVGVINKDTTLGNTYVFNKDFDKWVVQAKKDTKRGVINKDNEGVINKDNYLVSKKIYTKEKIKETRQKKEDSEQSSQEIPLLIKSFEAINPACKLFYGRPPQRKACQFLIDTYGFERVKIVIERTLPKTNTIKYFPVITTPQQLQDKWATLESKIKSYQAEKLQEKEKYKVAFT